MYDIPDYDDGREAETLTDDHGGYGIRVVIDREAIAAEYEDRGGLWVARERMVGFAYALAVRHNWNAYDETRRTIESLETELKPCQRERIAMLK